MAEKGKGGGIKEDDDSSNIPAKTQPGKQGNQQRNDDTVNGDRTYTMIEGGIRVIIDIQNFDVFQNRRGSSIDHKKLGGIVGHIKDVPIKQNDFTRDNIMKFLKALSEEDLSKYDFFMCVILSYGDHGYVHDCQGVKMKIDELVQRFKGDSCKSLLNKPKLFLIQTCPTRPKDAHDAFSAEACIDEKDEDIGHKIPVEADLLVVQSCIPGYLGWEMEEPSWFVEALTETFTGHSDKDILSLLTIVNGKLAKKIHEFKDDHIKRKLPYTSSTLRKDLYLKLRSET